MKRKHYPIVTVVIATLLTVVPLLFLSLLLQSHANDSDLASKELRGGNLRSSVEAEPNPSKVSDTAVAESKVIAVSEEGLLTPVAPLVAQRLEASTRKQRRPLSSRSDDVPLPIPPNSPPGNNVPDPAEAFVSELPEIPIAVEFATADFPRPLPVVAETNVVAMPLRPDAGRSYYEATGHLALRTQVQVPDPMANHIQSPARPDETHAVAGRSAVASVSSQKSKNRRSKSEEKGSAEAPSDPANSDPALQVDPPRPDIRSSGDDDAVIEEVVIQTPVESALVSRVENVVAMTRARGWPIALIRSDLPDDVWWVQQVVGIQGNAFAARVNFGNEYTLSGSGFSMVIVFLDSPDEVRRFRIAKQFKDIPAGVRRSREHHYIRN